MCKMNIMYDHYKDTYYFQKENEKMRNKIFLILCFLILILMLTIIYPNNIYENIKELFLYNFGININMELKILDVFNWFFILYLTIRYYQINVNIEKNYIYIHSVEYELENKYKLPICREGKNYLSYYPLFLQFTYVFYKYLFPVLFIVCILIKIYFNIVNMSSLLFLIVSLVLGGLIIFLNISYIKFNLTIKKE